MQQLERGETHLGLGDAIEAELQTFHSVYSLSINFFNYWRAQKAQPSPLKMSHYSLIQSEVRCCAKPCQESSLS